MGGAGFGVKLLYDLVQPGTDPLGPSNVLVFAPGPLTGTSAPCSSRITVTGRSPLTGVVGMATSGGEFPAEMKLAGFDIIVIQGQASDPVYLVLEKGEVSFARLKGFGAQIQQIASFLSRRSFTIIIFEWRVLAKLVSSNRFAPASSTSGAPWGAKA